jgi:phosphohistidine phosphatase
MEVAIFRHAHSLSVSESGADVDFDRILSERGMDEVKKSAINLKNEKFLPKIIFSSPIKRAVETAKIIGDILDIKDIVITDLLKPSNDINKIIDLIKSENHNTVVVSHIPFVDDLLYGLSGTRFLFTTGSYVRVSINGEKDVKVVSKYIP